MQKNSKSWFFRHFLNTKFATIAMNVLLALLVIWMFTKVAWLFAPVLNFIGIIAPPFLLAGILYYLLLPIVNWLNRLGLPRVAAILLVFVVVIALLILAIVLVIPPIESQIKSLVTGFPGYWQAFVEWLNDLNARQTFISETEFTNLMNQLKNSITSNESSIVSGTLASIQGVIATIGNVVVTIATAPIILFFMLKEGDRFTPMFIRLFPVKLRESFKQMLHEMNEKVGSYVQGQLTVAFAVAIIFMIGYSIIGLRFALVLGLLAGPLNMIPYFGSAVALIPALVVGWLNSPQMFIAVIVVFLVEWLLETQLISPFIMGSKLEMHPVTIVVVLLTAGDLFGLLGVIIGIPGFAVLRIVVTRLFNWYAQVSGLYEEDGTGPDKDSDTTNLSLAEATPTTVKSESPSDSNKKGTS